MTRAVVLALLLFGVPRAVCAQTLSVLHIKVTLTDADGKVTPVPRHSLLISDNPPTREPRRVVTTLDGTADVRLRPGKYTVESDQPVMFQGKAYHWTQIVDVGAGDAALELTLANAIGEAVAPGATAAGGTDPLAATDTCPVAAVRHRNRPVFGLQFHPEVSHTPYGSQILHNFLHDVCGCQGLWKMEAFIEQTVKGLRERIGPSLWWT